MKRIFKIILFVLLSGVVLYSEDAKDNVQNFLNIMIRLEKESDLMKEAFLKNSQSLVEVRQRRMTNILKDLKNIPTNYYLDNKTKKFENIVRLRVMRIDEELENMGSYLRHKDMENAFKSYVNILNECNGCHVIFRD